MPLLKWLRGDPNKFQELPGDEEEEEEDGSADERRGMNGPIEGDGVPGFLHSNETLLISEEGEIKNTLNASREPTERPAPPPHSNKDSRLKRESPGSHNVHAASNPLFCFDGTTT